MLIGIPVIHILAPLLLQEMEVVIQSPEAADHQEDHQEDHHNIMEIQDKEIAKEVQITPEVPLAVWELNSAFSTTEKLQQEKEKVTSKSEELNI